MHTSAIIEVIVLVLLAMLLLWPIRSRIRELARAIPRRYVVACVFGVLLLLAGQMASNGSMTYPFPDWDMYSASEPEDPKFVDYMARLKSGREERLLIGKLFPAGGRRFRVRIDNAAYAVDRAVIPEELSKAADDLNGLLAAVTREYNSRNPDDPIHSIQLWIASIPAQHYKGPDSISRKLLREYIAS